MIEPYQIPSNATVQDNIYNECWQKEKKGGKIGFSKDNGGNPSQEYYEFSINKFEIATPVNFVGAVNNGVSGNSSEALERR
jgi:hypothetical protein